MYIRGEWALRRWHWIEFWGTRGGAKGDFRWIFGLNPCIFEGAPTIFRKHMPWGMGTESLGMIGCIFGENGPLEGGLEWSLNGTVPGAKGEFRRFSYPYPYIFESRTPTFFESKCPELCAQQSWEWSDAYSWRNDLCKVEFERVWKKLAGVLMVIWSGFLAPTRAFSKGAPYHFPNAHALRYRHRNFGNDRMYNRGEWALRRWHWIEFWGTRGCAKGDFRWIFGLNPCIFEGAPTISRKHMPWGMGTESLGMIGCIFGENGPLEGGIEWSLNGTLRGGKGEFRRFSYLYPYIFESRTPTFFESKCPELCAQQSWEWSDAYSWRNDLCKVEFERVCKKPAGVLMVLWSGFLALTRAFLKRALTIFRKHMPWSIGTESLGMIGCIFAENGPLEGGIESSFSGTGWGAKGQFRWIFDPNPCIFEGGLHQFQQKHALRYGHRKFGDDRIYIRGE